MISIILTLIGIAGLFFFAQSEKDSMARYQVKTLLMAISLFLINRMFVADHQIGLRGDLTAAAPGLGFLGFPKESTWRSVTPTFLIIPFLITVFVVYLQILKGRKFKFNTLISALGISLILSILNSLTEEIIFRVIAIEGLSDSWSPKLIAIICGIWFGIPHYFGNPGKVPGVVMATFLGWVSAKSMLETNGIAFAWLLHYIQDVPIIAMLILAKRPTKL